MTAAISLFVVLGGAILRLNIVDFLKDEGFIVWEAGTAAKAVDALVEHQEIRPVLTDVDMPGAMMASSSPPTSGLGGRL